MAWDRPRNLFTERLPVFVRTYLRPPAIEKGGLGQAGRYVIVGWQTGED